MNMRFFIDFNQKLHSSLLSKLQRGKRPSMFHAAIAPLSALPQMVLSYLALKPSTMGLTQSWEAHTGGCYLSMDFL